MANQSKLSRENQPQGDLYPSPARGGGGGSSSNLDGRAGPPFGTDPFIDGASRRGTLPDMSKFPYNMMGAHIQGDQPVRRDAAQSSMDGRDVPENYSGVFIIHPDAMVRPDPPRNKYYVVVNGKKVGIFPNWLLAQDAARVSGGTAPSYHSWDEALADYRQAFDEGLVRIEEPYTPTRAKRSSKKVRSTQAGTSGSHPASPGASGNPIYVSSASTSVASTPTAVARSPSPGTSDNPIYVNSATSTPQRGGRPANPETTPETPPPTIQRRPDPPTGYRSVYSSRRVVETPSASYTRVVSRNLVPITPESSTRTAQHNAVASSSRHSSQASEMPSTPQRRINAVEAAVNRAQAYSTPSPRRRYGRPSSPTSVLAEKGSDDEAFPIYDFSDPSMSAQLSDILAHPTPLIPSNRDLHEHGA